MSGHPYTPLPFAKSAAEHLPKPNIDPSTVPAADAAAKLRSAWGGTAPALDTLSNGSLESPSRATPEEPPRNIEPHVGPIPNVPEYRPPADYLKHDDGTPVHNSGGENER